MIKIDNIRSIKTEEEFNNALISMQSKYSIINRNGKVFILCEDDYKGELIYTTVESFEQFYKHLYVDTPIVNSTKMNHKELAKVFMKDQNTKRLDGIIFDPDFEAGVVYNNGDDNKKPLRKYNLWKGWTYHPFDEELPDLSLFLRLVNVNCNYNKTLVEYFLNYCAHAIQKPKQIPRTAIVFKGPPGSGKGTLINDTILRLSKNSVQITDVNMVTGQFNGHLADKFFICLDEVMFGGNHQEANKFKTFISESTRMINDKQKTAFTVDSYSRVFILSNNDFVVKVEDGDRRYVIIETSDELQGDFEFFKKYQDWLSKFGFNSIMKYLTVRDITGFNPLEIPKTREKADLQLMALDNTKRYIYEWLNGDINIPAEAKLGDKIYMKNIYLHFVEYVKQLTKSNYIPTQSDFSRAMNKSFNFEENWKNNWSDSRGRYYRLIDDKEYLQKLFAKNIMNTTRDQVFNSVFKEVEVEDTNPLVEA